MLHHSQVAFKLDVLNYQTGTYVAEGHRLEDFPSMKPSNFFFGEDLHHEYLGGGFKYFLFAPLFGEDFQFD